MSGVLVQRMAPEGVEMFIGGLQDPAFGPVFRLGLGETRLRAIHAPVAALGALSAR
jgi:acyl-CoA synthetase (NDP forming)